MGPGNTCKSVTFEILILVQLQYLQVVVFFSVPLAAVFPLLFPVFFVGDFVSLADCVNHAGNLRVFCNKGAGSTAGFNGELLSFLR